MFHIYLLPRTRKFKLKMFSSPGLVHYIAPIAPSVLLQIGAHCNTIIIPAYSDDATGNLQFCTRHTILFLLFRENNKNESTY